MNKSFRIVADTVSEEKQMNRQCHELGRLNYIRGEITRTDRIDLLIKLENWYCSNLITDTIYFT